MPLQLGADRPGRVLLLRKQWGRNDRVAFDLSHRHRNSLRDLRPPSPADPERIGVGRDCGGLERPGSVGNLVFGLTDNEPPTDLAGSELVGKLTQPLGHEVIGAQGRTGIGRDETEHGDHGEPEFVGHLDRDVRSRVGRRPLGSLNPQHHAGSFLRQCTIPKDLYPEIVPTH